MFAKVLVPTDFSSYADAVLHCIQGIPGIREVVLLHVAPWSSDVSARKATTENLRGQLSRYEEELRKGGLEVSSLVLTTPAAGSISETILRVAREENVSLILIGARGKGIIRGILLGSVSSEIVRRAPADVLIMRHKVLETLEGVRYEKFCPRIYAKILIPTDFSDASRRSLALLDDLPGVGE
ncbi:MAG: universal stress protein, partial [Methanomicrobiales archaeon]|nr:universal stress protein [Methanomicrobiales archaeon]